MDNHRKNRALPIFPAAKWTPLVKTVAMKVAITIWYNEDIRLLQYPIQEHTLKRVAAKVRKLNIPEILKRQVEDLLGPIGDHITIWKRNLDRDRSVLDLLNWTEVITWKAAGTIDTRTTAKRAIQLGVLSDVQVFRLAASNCMADLLFKMWPTLRLSSIESVSLKRRQRQYDREWMEVQFWMACLSNDAARWLEHVTEGEPSVHSPLQMTEFGFRTGLGRGNEEFCLYHMDRLDESEKEELVLKSMKSVLTDPVILCTNPYLFYRIVCGMRAENRSRLFQEHPHAVLMMLLQWPLQDMFLDATREVQGCLGAHDFVYVLNGVARKAYGYEGSETYRSIFVGFWEGATADQREHYISEWVFKKFLCTAFGDMGAGAFAVLRESERLLGAAMFRSGHLVADVTLGHCYLDILESILAKYFRGSSASALQKMQAVVRHGRSYHRCYNLCSPKRFATCVFTEKIYRIVSQNVYAQS